MDREKIFETIYYHKFPNAVRYKFKPILHDEDSEKLADKLTALFDVEAITDTAKIKEIASQCLVEAKQELVDEAKRIKEAKREGRKEVVERIVNDTGNFEVPLSLGLIVKLTDWNL